MTSPQLPRELWSHPDPQSTQVYQFMQLVNKDQGLNLSTFQDLYRWSIDNRSKFYAQIFDFVNLIHAGSYKHVVDESAPINELPHWFEGIQLNFAENVLWSRGSTDRKDHHGTKGKEDSKIAITAVREGCTELKEVSWGELRARSAQYAAAMKAAGVGKGDRVVVVGSNSIETQLVLIATTWVGAIFSSSSSDMGAQGVLQRTVQIDPKLIFMDDAAVYNGKTLDLRDKMGEILEGMKPCTNFQGLISIPRYENQPLDIIRLPRTQTLAQFLSSSSSASPNPPPIERVAFHDPFLICYSSGTTGIPKAIVHSVGGVLISLTKEGRLHGDSSSSDVALQYTTVGWIMLLQIPAQLCLGARVVLYDGSPFIPDAKAFVRLIGDQKVTTLGISPRWMGELAKAGLSPRELTDCSSLRLVTSTGMVLSDELFEWFYDKGFPARVHLSNISGGTDIAGCFAAGNPLTPVRVGGCSGPSLGVAIAVFDSLADPGCPGKPVPDGTPGELVATASFPNVPVFLWGDAAQPNERDPARRDQSKYHGAYFARYSNGVWAHGDHIVVDGDTGGITFLGRADGVLNPSGVRFGSAEIYSVLEKGELAEEIADSVVVGQRRPKVDSDESVMLFLMMRPGRKFSEDLVRRVRAAIAKERSKRHVPRYIFETPEIPTTINGKKIEIAVKKIVCGETVKPSGTVANPESLKYYYQFAKVEELLKPKAKL
ncbi:acetoacetyl-coenzyme A synthetase [Microdochium bolleyi]|uniref:Acetoacetyl-coenzyme A synthetase n=1 Tax=Microdochium bolleyi TaxID=196109 RepID=A0A136J6R5_9PEZI|nr:acetoacetyl-coenzyme A synthetase [Microdochium bolleyi]